LQTKLSAQSQAHLTALCAGKAEVNFVDVSSVIETYRGRKDFPLTLHFTEETYYRLFLPHLLPKVDKVLYLDADTLILHPLEDLYHTDLGNNYLGVTHDCEIVRVCHIMPPEAAYFVQQLQVRPETYFQAGVMVMNLALMRQEHLTQKLLACLEQLATPKYVDQDVLNVVCQNRVKFVAQKWNFTWHLPLLDSRYDAHLPQPYLTLYQQAEKEPYIVHFTGENKKPVDLPRLTYSRLWFRYVAQSPYFDKFWQQMWEKCQQNEDFVRHHRGQLFRYKWLRRSTWGTRRQRYALKYDALYARMFPYGKAEK
jgi:lipopolysaccharide biosynthesis glycosyltransferase